jgi:hypothetical protein
VHDALLGPDPAQLRVRNQVPPRRAPVEDERVERLALDARAEELYGGADKLVATADGEGLAPR